MDEGIDTGDMILQRRTPILDDDDAGTLAARLAELGAPLLAESLTLAHEGRAPRAPQDSAADRTRASSRSGTARCDWSARGDARCGITSAR